MESRQAEASVVVRPATEDDFAEALDLYSLVAEEAVWIGAEAPVDRVRLLKKWKRRLADGREAFFIAEVQSAIVGLATMDWVGASELGMLVDQKMRGRGVGKALLRACLDWARVAGVHKIELKVWPHNEAAIALYEGFGFEKEGYLKRHYRRRSGAIWDCIIMGLQLPVPEVNDDGAP